MTSESESTLCLTNLFCHSAGAQLALILSEVHFVKWYSRFLPLFFAKYWPETNQIIHVTNNWQRSPGVIFTWVSQKSEMEPFLEAWRSSLCLRGRTVKLKLSEFGRIGNFLWWKPSLWDQLACFIGSFMQGFSSGFSHFMKGVHRSPKAAETNSTKKISSSYLFIRASCRAMSVQSVPQELSHLKNSLSNYISNLWLVQQLLTLD